MIENKMVSEDWVLLKYVRGILGDSFCIKDIGEAFVNETSFGFQDASIAYDHVWKGCSVLKQKSFALLSSKMGSFDSRYFGPISRNVILGRLVPIWVRK